MIEGLSIDQLAAFEVLLDDLIALKVLVELFISEDVESFELDDGRVLKC